MDEFNEQELVYDFLNDLRDSGVTNMFSAGSFLMEEFNFDEETAVQWLSSWMQDFSI